MIAITVIMQDGQTVEAGAIGSREVAGINAFMGCRETTQTKYVVQLPGDAMTIATQQLKIEFDRNGEMRDLMLRYTQAFLAQISQNVACNRLHGLDQRLARWLLEVRMRIQLDEFPLTHELIAVILGVRRSGVTAAAKKLKDQGLIRYNRGSIKITDGAVLENLSCECYSTLLQEYDRLLGGKKAKA
jgi:hypothetical protein